MGRAADMRLRTDELRRVDCVLDATARSESIGDLLAGTLAALDEHAGVTQSAFMLVFADGTQAYAGVRHGAPDYVLEEYFERWLPVDPLASPAARASFLRHGTTGVAELYAHLDSGHRRFVDDYGPRTKSLEHLSMRIPIATTDGYLTVLGGDEPSPLATTICAALVPRLAEMMRERLPRGLAPGSLSPRECQVAELVTLGFSNREIGATLGIEERTVEKHLERVYARLEIRSRTELAASWAIGHKVGPLPHG